MALSPFLLFAVEGLEVISCDDLMVAASPSFERAQNSLDVRRRVPRPWMSVVSSQSLRAAWGVKKETWVTPQVGIRIEVEKGVASVQKTIYVKKGQSTNLDNENKLLQERGRSTAPTTDVRADLDV
jgi:hypothetical protein